MAGKAERTRQHIIEKAAPFFNKKGYADTSLSDITAATGLTKGAIYGNFENKDELALAVFSYNLDRLAGGMLVAMQQQDNAVDQLLAMIRYYRQAYRQVAVQGGCPVMNAAVEADDNFPALKVKVKGAVKSWSRTIARIIDTGKKEGTIRQQTDAGSMATLLIALIEGGLMLAKLADEASPLQLTLDRAEEIIRKEIAK
ncbi:MAG: TetR/AcrR family transcriptional regulator [Chitinophagaceae bacterium]